MEVNFIEKREKDPLIQLLMEKVENDAEMIYGLFVNFFNTFCNAGGLTAISEIVNNEVLGKRANIPNYKLPLDIVAMVLAPLRSIRSIAKENVIKEIVTIGEKAFFQRLYALDVKEVKDINKETIANAMLLMKGFLKLQYTEEHAAKVAETHEMLIALKFLQSPYLEKRLNGLADIKKMIDIVEKPAIQMKYSQKVVLFTSDYLAKWIVENNILGIILNENAHAELVKRTSSILIFLAKKKEITKDMIELLWKCQQDKHEDIIRVVYDTIRDIVEYITIDVFVILL